jgi:hypothetical protein
MNRTFAICVSIALAAGLAAFAGCGDTKKGKTKTGTSTAKKDDHDHAHEGPHGGDLIELDDYHAEFVHDEATQKMTFYILDGEAKKGVPISASEVVVNYVAEGKPQQTKVPAKPDEGEKEGESSRFEIVSKELCDAICDNPKANAKLVVMINDKSYTGAIEHHEHDHDKK